MRIIDFLDGFESSSEPTTSGFSSSGVSVTPNGNLSSDNVQDGLEELQGDIDTINNSIGSASGIAQLDGDGKVPVSQLPALAIIEVYAVEDITERDALTVQEGDVAVVADDGNGVSKTYIYDGASWLEIIADGSLSSHQVASTGVHGVTGTVVGTSDAQVLTNKDIDGGTAANNRRITLPKNTKSNLDALDRKEATLVYATDDQKVYYDDGSTLKAVGTGSGSGGINYISNTDIETDASGYSAYADAAATSPVDGTGGSPNITVERSTSSPRRGTASLLITKDAANRQGEGVSYDFTIDAADKSKQLAIEFDYESSANYTGSSGSEYMTAWVYDVTNSVLIATSNVNIPHGSGTQKITFNATTSTSYRLIFHVSGTGTSAWTMKLDNIKVGPQEVVLGFPGSDPESYTPNFSGLGTVTSIDVKKQRNGNRLLGFGTFTTGTAAASTASFSLPSGLALDSTAIPSASGVFIVGTWGRGATSEVGGGYLLADLSTSSTLIYFGQGIGVSGANVLTKANGSGNFGNSEAIKINFDVPIANWSSNIQLANSRVEYASNSGMGDAADTSSFVNDPNGSPIPTVSYSATRAKRVRFKNPIQAGDTIQLQVKPNNSVNFWIDMPGVYQDAGSTNNVSHLNFDTGYGLGAFAVVNSTDVDVYFGRYTTSGSVNWSGSNTSRWRVVKYSNSVPVESLSRVNASYETNAGQSIANGSTVIVDFEDRLFDANNCVTTGASWKFTAPRAGVLRVTSSIPFAGASFTAGSRTRAWVYKNGSVYKMLSVFTCVSSAAQDPHVGGSALVNVNAGDYVDIRVRHPESSARSLSTEAGGLPYVDICYED